MLQKRSCNILEKELITSNLVQSDDPSYKFPPIREFSTTRLCLRPESFLTTLKNDVNLYKNISKDLIYQKYAETYIFFEQLSHRDEVRAAREKVTAVQVFQIA